MAKLPPPSFPSLLHRQRCNFWSSVWITRTSQVMTLSVATHQKAWFLDKLRIPEIETETYILLNCLVHTIIIAKGISLKPTKLGYCSIN